MRIFCPRNSLLSACATALLLLTASQVVFAEKNTVQDSEGSDSDTPPAATLLKSTTSAAPEASTSTTTKTTSSTATTDSATATSDSREELSSESLIYLRARSKINKGDAAGAVTDLSALLEKSQNKPKYLRERARAFYRLKDYQKAMSDIEASLKAEQNAWAFDMRGLIKTALGDIAGAAADDTTAISLEKRPKSAYQFYYNRALTRQ
jgi:tetratricopeptide (TPR) repeat protein